MRVDSAAAVLAFALLAVPVGADEQAEKEQFDAVDANHDGYIDKGEWRRSGGQPGNFDAKDCNGDKALSFREWQNKPHKHGTGKCVK